MFIMALDAATKSTGLAIFEGEQLVEYACLTASSMDVIARIQKIVNNIEEYIMKYNVKKIILEQVQPKVERERFQTQRVLLWLQGQIAIMVHDRHPNCEVEFILPNSWRKKCGIHTGAGVKRDELKLADIKFVKDTYGLTVNDDIADAIGIGHSYVH